jgi:hypothetical protein
MAAVTKPRPNRTIAASRFQGIGPVGTLTCTPLAGPEYGVEMAVTACRGAGGAGVKRLSVVL